MSSILTELQSIAQMLHLTHHRNKNQHRLSRWWKAFSMLRRNISKLIEELETNVQYTALSAKSKKTKESREIVQRRVVFLEDVLVEKCYVAFGGLVADNQYASLGLMLIGMLARFRKVIEPLRENEKRVLKQEGKGLAGDETQDQDVGEVVRREEILGGDKVGAEEDRDAESLKITKTKKRHVTAYETEPVLNDSTPLKRSKKKRKKGDAFDDLFADLV